MIVWEAAGHKRGAERRRDAAVDSESSGPLTGVRVLDLTRVVMGPLATQVLADQGADVVVVESLTGDTNRVMGPGPHPELSGVSLNLLRNKRSVALDLRDERARAEVRRLVASADVLVTTMRPQALRGLGLDYATVRELKSDLIYCQGQGFRLDGPHADAPAYDDIMQAATGVGHVTAEAFGEPRLLPTVLADKACGLMMAQAVSAALYARERNGQGCHIEIPMEESMIAFMLVEHGAGAVAGTGADGTAESAGYARILTPQRRPQRTADGWIQMLPYLPQHYGAIFKASTDPDEAGIDESRYRDRRSAIANSEGLYRDLHRIATQRTTEDWLAFCRKNEIPVSRVRSLDDLVRTLRIENHPEVGPYHVLPGMARFDAGGTPVRRHAPLIGGDTESMVWVPFPSAPVSVE